jgi:hypothetical protein
MAKHTFRNLVFSAVLISLLIISAVLIFLQRLDQQSVGCTADAKICDDGSAVGREGPKCEFAACPDMSNHATLQGKVSISPICPVEIQGQRCETLPEAYLNRGIAIEGENGFEKKFVNFGFDGTYMIKLPAGKYKITLIPTGIDTVQELPLQLNLAAKETKQLDLYIDTGIR